MTYHLTVVHEFSFHGVQYDRGQRITAADEVQLILDSPLHSNVVKTLAPADSSEPPALPQVAPADPE